jgi:hypothetical protein
MRLPAKSSSKGIQRQHPRKFKSGKVTVVNKGLKKNAPAPFRAQQKGGGTRFELPPPPKQQAPPGIILKPKERTTDEDKKKRDKSWDRHAEDLVAALTLPTITWPGYEDSYPEMLRSRAQTDRMIQLMKSPDEFREFSTDGEALGYLSTASFIAPMDRDHVEIMQYLFNKVMPKETIPSDLEVIKGLDSNQETILKRLKQWIRKKQWKALKAKQKEGTK